MARLILLVLASSILACEAKFPTGLAACPGYENHPFQFISGSIPEVFNFPGNALISYESKRSVDLPTDLVMKFNLRKVTAITYDVPCVNGQGSCEYEVCDNKYFTKELCAQYPSFQQCGCPLKAGGYALKDVNVDLPDIGVLKPIVAGNYEGKALFYGRSNPDNVLGCVNIAFSVGA